MSAVAVGFRVKSGYAVAVAASGSSSSGTPTALLRQRIELSDPSVEGTKQPFHADFGTEQTDSDVITRLVTIIEKCAERSLGSLLTAEPLAGHQLRAACLVVGSVIDPAQVKNPHIRAHASEGRLFRTVLEQALAARGVPATVIVEKQLGDQAAKILRRSKTDLTRTVAQFGRTLGSPWRVDEKAAALGAWMALSAPLATQSKTHADRSARPDR